MNRLHIRPGRLLAALLALVLVLTPAASALTPQQTLELLEYYYVDDLPQGLEELDSVDEILAALGDPYTAYLTAEEYAAFVGSINDGSVVGIGVTCQVTGEGLLITSVLDDSPALEAGLESGDLITAADGQSLAGLGDAATALVQGEAGTQVTLTVRRADGRQEQLTLTRREVAIPHTTTQVLPGGQGYILCESFGDETVDHIQQGLTDYDDQVTGWVVDLRTNPGGSSDSAAGSAASFLGPGVLTYFVDGDGNVNYTFAPAGFPRLTTRNVLVLTSPYSASGSELFAAALRDNQACTILGSRTFGKGVAQIILTGESFPEYFPDGDALKVTVYRFYSPQGTTNDKIGVIPHLLVSDETAAALAALFSGAEPADSAGWLALIISGITWYIDLEQAQSEEYRAAFTELLEAVPPTAALERGLGGGSWMPVSAADLAAQLGLDWAGRGFSDSGDSPYAQAIETLACYRLLAGDGTGRVYPHETLTRGELASLLASLLRLTPAGTDHFTDVEEGAWYADGVNAAYEQGLIAGDGDGTYRPDDPVTREEMISILAQVGAWLNMDLAAWVRDYDPAQGDLLVGFSDWARPGASLCDHFGLLWDDPAQLDAAAPALREEAAVLLYQLLCAVNLLPV